MGKTALVKEEGKGKFQESAKCIELACNDSS
jgi:hypothetical protein